MAKEMAKANKKEDIVQEIKNEKVEPATNHDDEMNALKKQLADLQSLILAQQATISQQQNTTNTVVVSDGYIRADRSIMVMSLTSNLLNLSTMGGGKGKAFTFRKFGDIKNIVYADLAEILHHYQKYAEAGAFYIFDEEVVKRHGLESIYENILDKKGIDTFLDRDVNDVKNMFSKLSDIQKESVVKNIINKIISGDDISVGKINAIKEIYGNDIFAMAEEMQNWEKEVEELER